MKLTVGSLFTGAGGFDLGFQRAGCKVIWMCERDKHCKQLLKSKFPGVPIYSDVKDLLKQDLLSSFHQVEVPDIIIGGDPCPAHSNAKGNRKSIHPDLSGYFLAVVGRLAPKWVVRENVPSPVTVGWFATALESLGYSTCIIWANSSQFIPQNRERSFVIGCTSESTLTKLISKQKTVTYQNRVYNTKQQYFNCIVAERSGPFGTENFIWEQGNGIRSLHSNELELITGFPNEWTKNFSNAVRKRMCGNAVTPQVAEAIGIEIVKASKGIKNWKPLDTEAGSERLLSRFLV